jgi:hypothetical protein
MSLVCRPSESPASLDMVVNVNFLLVVIHFTDSYSSQPTIHCKFAVKSYLVLYWLGLKLILMFYRTWGLFQVGDNRRIMVKSYYCRGCFCNLQYFTFLLRYWIVAELLWLFILLPNLFSILVHVILRRVSFFQHLKAEWK